jgi:hypothetical protein
LRKIAEKQFLTDPNPSVKIVEQISQETSQDYLMIEDALEVQ